MTIKRRNTMTGNRKCANACANAKVARTHPKVTTHRNKLDEAEPVELASEHCEGNCKIAMIAKTLDCQHKQFWQSRRSWQSWQFLQGWLTSQRPWRASDNTGRFSKESDR